MADLIVKVGGEGGTDSPTTAGEFITLTAIREGNAVFTLRTLPAEIKGGLATYQTRMSDADVVSQGDGPDVLCCMNQESFDELHGELPASGGVLVYDTDSVHLNDRVNGGTTLYGVPMSSIANDEVKERRTKNMVLLGALAELFGLPMETLKQCVAGKYGRRSPDLVQLNHSALDAGAAFVAANLTKSDPFRFASNPERAKAQRMVVDGSEAVAMGAAVAQCELYAGYPITPASDIMHWLANHLPKFGGTVIQTEDEIAALGVCLGASFAGRKSMTATSGPGLALMVEMIGLAVMTELPVVIVDAMRGGPSTGLPTKCESGDLNLAVYGAHGDAPRIVVAPANIRDCLYDTAAAFSLAEKYQTPVLVLSDQSMAMRTQAIAPPDLTQIRVERRLLQTKFDPNYKRYRTTKDNVSPVVLPGQGIPSFYTLTGLAHDEYGHPATNDGALGARMMDRRARKIARAAREPGWSRTHGPDTAELGVISWGSIEGSVVEAVDRLCAEGKSVRCLHLRMLSPLPADEIAAFAATVKKVVVCELNQSGQLNRMIRSECLIPTSLVNKYDGVPYTPSQVVEALREEF